MEVDPWQKKLEQGPSQARNLREDETKWHGTLGSRIPLVANYLKPHCIKPGSVIEYKVKIVLGARKKRECTVGQECRKYFWRAVFDPAHQRIFLSQNQLVYDDHSALFSAEPLRNPDTGRPMVDGETFVLPYQYQEEERAIPIMLTIQRTSAVYIGPPLSLHALQFLTLLTTQAARRPVFDVQLNFVPTAQAWFGENNRIYVLPYEGGNVWPITPATTLLRGLRCAMRLDSDGLPILNVSLIHSLFAKANFWLIDVYAIIQGERPLTEDERSQMRDWSMDSSQTSQLESELKGMVLRTTYGPKRDYKLLSIDCQNPGERRFRTVKYGDVTAQEFYRAHHGITLKFPCLPLFRMHPEEQKVYIPMELLTISGKVQRIVRKLQSSFVGRVCQAATMKPAEHFRAIEQLASRADVMTSSTENTFGVSFSPPEEIQMMRVDGRVLPFPECMFTLNTKVMADQPVPEATSKPVVLGLVPVGSIPQRLCANAVRQLMAMSRERGITFREANPRLYPYNDVAPYNDLDAFLSAVSSDVFVAPGHARTPNAYGKHEVSFMLIFCVREENSDLHDKVKAYCEMAELGFGLETQFILEKTLRKMTTREGGRGHLATIGSLVL